MGETNTQNHKHHRDTVKCLLKTIDDIAGLQPKLEQNPTTTKTENIKAVDVLFHNYEYNIQVCNDYFPFP